MKSNDHNPEPFWTKKQLSDMTHDEWESLCDGCGYCCLVKIEDIDTNECFLTNVTCHMLELEHCRCQDYSNRLEKVSSCVDLKTDLLTNLPFLPETCAYKRIYNGKPLPHWHPLLNNGDNAGVPAVNDFSISEEFVHPDQLQEHITESLPAGEELD